MMKAGMNVLAGIVLFTVGVAGAGAEDLQKSGNTALGKVKGIYVQAARGLYIETRILPVATAVSAKHWWADVSLEEPNPDGRQSTMAVIEKGVAVAEGDLVELRVARSESQNDSEPALMREVSKIVRVAARASNPVTLADGGQCTAVTHDDRQSRESLAARRP